MIRWVCMLVVAIVATLLGGVWWLSSGRNTLESEDQIVLADDQKMPACYEGFVDRWNEEARTWLERELRHAENAGNEQAKRASELQERLKSGPYLTLKSESDVPTSLEWENGLDEPEIGDPKAVKGGHMRLWNGGPYPSTFRPFGPNSKSFFGYSMYDQVEMKLVAMHPVTQATIPGLADRWAIGSDGRTIFYHLDPDAKYSDGQKIRAEDFILNLCVRTHPAAKEPYWEEEYLKKIEHITVYGESVLAVTLPTAIPWMEYRTAGLLAPASPQFYREFNASYLDRYQWRVPPATGGYRLEASSVVRGRELTLKRVPNWWAEKKKYYRYSCNVDRITHYFLNDSVLALELFRRGDLDALFVTKAEVWDEVGNLPDAINGYILRTAFAHRIPEPPYGISINTSCPPLDRLQVRQGLMHALDVEAICERVFHGKAQRLSSYLEGLGALTNDSLTPPKYDPHLARELFEQAGFDRVDAEGILMDHSGQRLQIELVYPANSASVIVAACHLFKEQAKACGVDLVLDPLEGSVCSRKISDRRYQLAFWATLFSAPVPDIYQSFHSSAARDSSGRVLRDTENIFCLADEEMDDYLQKVQEAQDLETLRTNLHAVQRRIHDLAIWIPGWKDPFARLAYWRWVHWPNSKETRFSVPDAYNPLESHLYWMEPQEQEKLNEARRDGITFPEVEETVYP